MNDYSDIFYLIGAILVFSLLSMQVNRLIFRNNLIQMQSGVEYHVVTHAQDYADQIQFMRSEDDLDDFADLFPRTDSVSFDDSDPSAVLPFLVNVEVSDTTLVDSNVDNKFVRISLNNQFLEREDISVAVPTRTIVVELIKSFVN